MKISHPHACYIHNPSGSSYRQTPAFQIPRYNKNFFVQTCSCILNTSL